MTFPMPFMSPASGVFTWELSDTAIDNVDRSTYTFSSADLGPVAADRKVAVLVAATRNSATPAITSSTINGVSATEQASDVSSATRERLTAVIDADVPSGATGDIVINFDGTLENCSIAVFSMFNLSTGLVDADANNRIAGSTDDFTLLYDASAGGLLIAICNRNSTNDFTSPSFDATANLTSDTSDFTYAYGDTPSGVSGGNLTFDVDSTGSITVAFASYR